MPIAIYRIETIIMDGLGQRENQGKLGEMSWERNGKRPQNRWLTAFLLVHPQLCFLSFCWVGRAIVDVKAWHVGLCPAAQKDILPPCWPETLGKHKASTTSSALSSNYTGIPGGCGVRRGGEGRMRANAAATSCCGTICVFNYWQLPTDVQTHLDQSQHSSAETQTHHSYLVFFFFFTCSRRKWAAEARNTHAPRHRNSTACRPDSLGPEPDRPVLDVEAPPRLLVSFQTGGAPRRHFPPCLP